MYGIVKEVLENRILLSPVAAEKLKHSFEQNRFCVFGLIWPVMARILTRVNFFHLLVGLRPKIDEITSDLHWFSIRANEIKCESKFSIKDGRSFLLTIKILDVGLNIGVPVRRIMNR